MTDHDGRSLHSKGVFSVLSAMGARHPLLRLFQSTNAIDSERIDIHFEIAGAVRDKLLSGSYADVVILPRPYIDELSERGLIVDESARDIMRPQLAAFVQRGKVKPSVSTAKELRVALLEAKSFCYTNPAHGGVSGTEVRTILDRLDIATQMEAKATLGAPGAQPTQLVSAGKVELGIVQLSEIIGVEGIECAGILPDCFQPDFPLSAAVTEGSRNRERGASLVAWLCSRPALDVFNQCGMRGFEM